ncbi:MAG: DUF3313 domain-containing protein [Candidatus Scalindua sp. AMX11]|nr:MAG: DUF3313 domain-containing protein [Candidatus Scalindua sp.]NOG85581.1 DUF3313 domain-containing protein [Planctomycetota bacterium]RZV90172.1 MAG: DUF3313 domain-containing protein [Candidatus Scalindua sp. SCAELEC01]TDE64951.1 MAG: DUF3313 domain-containing protein [Candidatus Scalindua sp. AMX11]GJQ59610.1 MAG: lipoprotein [Candidatus Scalindua sp.]
MKNVKGVILMLLIVSFVGCSQTHQARKAGEASGFLGDYSLLQEGEKGEAQLRYVNPDADFAAYDKVIVDPSAVWCSKDSKIPQDELNNLASHLHYKIVARLKGDYEVVQTPGPGVMRISAALTEAKKSKVGLDIITTIIPQAHLMSGLKRLATGTGAFVGGASVECKITDSNSGEMLAAAMDRQVGGKALKGSTKAWNDVEQAFEHWADQLIQRLREARAKKGY